MSHYMILKWDCIPCSAITRVSDFAWKAWNSLDCRRVPIVFESVTAMIMVSKKMSNRLLMKFARKHMNENHNVTRDVSHLRMVLIGMLLRNICHLQQNILQLRISWCAAILDRNIL